MATKYTYAGVVITLMLLIGTGVVYNITINEKGIEAKWESDKCLYGDLSLFIAQDGTNKLKCGRYIVAEWDSKVMHKIVTDLGEGWKINDRKTTKTEVRLIENTPEYFIIEKEEHYKLGSSGSDGVLIESYKFTKSGIKWSYNYTAENNREHYVLLRMKRFESKYGMEFLPEDPEGLLAFTEGTNYYYGGISGNLNIDPEIVYPSVVYEGEQSFNVTHDGIDYQEIRDITGYSHWQNQSYVYENCGYNETQVNLTCWENETNSTWCCNITSWHIVWNESYNGDANAWSNPTAIVYADARYNFDYYGFFVCSEIYVEELDETFTGVLGNGISIKDGYSYYRSEENKCKIKSGESAKGFNLETQEEIFKVGYFQEVTE